MQERTAFDNDIGKKINLSTMFDLFQLGMGQTLQAQVKTMLSLKVASNGSGSFILILDPLGF